jgi:hypothetical protein
MVETTVWALTDFVVLKKELEPINRILMIALRQISLDAAFR